MSYTIITHKTVVVLAFMYSYFIYCGYSGKTIYLTINHVYGCKGMFYLLYKHHVFWGETAELLMVTLRPPGCYNIVTVYILNFVKWNNFVCATLFRLVHIYTIYRSSQATLCIIDYIWSTLFYFNNFQATIVLKSNDFW